MNQATLPFDICANRHRNSETSIDANLSAEKTKTFWQTQILLLADSREDLTLKDACRFFDKLPNELSGRFSELSALGFIEKVKDAEGETVRREKCAVYQIVREKLNETRQNIS